LLPFTDSALPLAQFVEFVPLQQLFLAREQQMERRGDVLLAALRFVLAMERSGIGSMLFSVLL